MEETQFIKSPESRMSPREIVQKYIRFLPWVLVSVALALTLAWVKLRYSTPIYNVAGKLLVKDKNPYGNRGEKFSNIFALPDDNSNLNNEIEIIKSRSLAARTIRGLGFQRQYYIKGKIRTSVVHPSDMPFKWVINHISDSANGISYIVKIISNTQFQLNGELTNYNFNQPVKKGNIEFQLQALYSNMMISDPNEYIINWIPEENLAVGLSSTISVAKIEGTSVITIVFPTDNIKLGLNIVNQYMKEYLQSNYEDKKVIAFNTLQFIDNQLDTLKRELGGVERNLQNFREKNKLFAPDQQTELFFSDLTESNRQITTAQRNAKIVEYLSKYMSNPVNSDRLVPSNLGIEEPTLTAQITEFNTLQLKKQTLLQTTQPGNPLVQNTETAIEKLRQDILENLKNVRNAQQLATGDLSGKQQQARTDISAIPGKQKQLLEVTRQQAILQELYSFLLQKKLETAIASASTTSDIMILEPAMAGGTPVSPNPKGMYIIAVFLGLGLPIGIIFILEYLNDKVKSKLDITKVTSTPILGEIGHASESNTLIVRQNNRSYIAEQFRIVRSNLQYILPKNEKPVIVVTSSFSGEGKSFISTNLGAVLALSGKRTIILEMDIRKPKILKGLGMNERKGITNYLVTNNIEVRDIVYPVPELDNLFVAPCGPVPPNPAEILLDKKLDTMFEELKKQFDVIIIDSAPIGLVSDAITLGKQANACVYIVRHNYTLKKQVNLIKELYEEKKLPHLSIVINDISGSSGGYGYGYNYGYGYGYGYGNTKQNISNSYFENEGERKSWWPFGKK